MNAIYIMASERRGTLYIGVTSQLLVRVSQHREGAFDGFTKRYGVKRLVWFERHDGIQAALHREKRLKKFKREWKVNLIERDNPNWTISTPSSFGRRDPSHTCNRRPGRCSLVLCAPLRTLAFRGGRATEGSCQRLWEPAERLARVRHIAAAARAAGIAAPLSAAHSGSDSFIIMQIRQERPEDASTIRALTDAAFKDMPFSDQTEAQVIDRLRAASALTLSLVATEGGDIFGHVAFSPVRINGEAGDWYGLGPVSVWPDHQRTGIGQALIREGLQRLKSIGAGGCVLLGNPAYYGRFGFENDPVLYNVGPPPWAFQRLSLNGSRPSGEVSFHPAFDAA